MLRGRAAAFRAELEQGVLACIACGAASRSREVLDSHKKYWHLFLRSMGYHARCIGQPGYETNEPGWAGHG